MTYIGGAGTERKGEPSTEEIAILESFVDSVTWKFAKTMPFMPHWYALFERMEGDEQRALYKELVNTIMTKGVDEVKGKRTYRYLTIGEYKYWSMWNNPEEVILINRAFVRRWVTQEMKCDCPPKNRTNTENKQLDWL